MSKTKDPADAHEEYMTFTGCEKVRIQSGLSSVRNSFTYEMWVKPQAEIQIQIESKDGHSGIEGQKYVIGAEQGRDAREAGVGVSIGRNGVAIYEHAAEYLPAVLVLRTPLSDWVHIAVVYANLTPLLYINGVYVKQGLTSSKSTVCASGMFGGLDPYGFFVGHLKEIRLWDHARSSDQIQRHMNQELTGSERGLAGFWKFTKRPFIQDITGNGHDGTLGWGNYLLAVLNETHIIGKTYDASQVVDVIIPIYNCLEETKNCIESVYMNSDLPYNLYLINDCSSDPNVYSYLEELRCMEMPKSMQKLEIIHHKTNEGFVRSANQGVLLSKNDVILLNSDTEVPYQWMSRLMGPFALDEHIASVTPFSNNATICSFPTIFRDNPMPPNLGVEDVDTLFRRYGTDLPIEIPTAVGFCMAIKREALTRIGLFDEDEFGMGYGEENDWCMRAQRVGLKNVLVPNLFVFHKGGSSFSENADVQRSSQQQQNLEKIVSRYPSYLYQVQKFTQEDPARDIRETISSATVLKTNSQQSGVLFLLHNTGGGTEHFQNQYIAETKHRTRVYRLMHGSSRFVFSDLRDEAPTSLHFDSLNQELFQKLLTHFNINLIHVDHLISFPIPAVMDFIQNSGVDYKFHAHDYFSVCPRTYLINHQNVYCNDETDIQICQHCMNHSAGIDIQFWRKRFSSFLDGAKQVIAPSISTREIIQKYYPWVQIDVQEHTLPAYIHHTFNPQFIEEPELNVAVIGDIGYHKGSLILYQLRESIRQANLPITIKVIGITQRHWGYFQSDDRKFLVTGRFSNQEISDLLAMHKISVVIVPSICPETYSYTTSEAMLSGYPVIAFNLGAPARRIVKYDGGWVVTQLSSSSILDVLRKLLQNRHEILEKATNLHGYPRGS